MRIHRFLLTTLIALSAVSCLKEEPKDAGSVILATVGNETISDTQLQQEITRRTSARIPVDDPATVLDEMILRTAMIQEAIQSGIDRDPEVRRSIENLLIGKLKDKELRPRLESQTVAEEDLLSHYRENATDYLTKPMAQLAMLRLKASPQRPAEIREHTRNRMEEARRMAIAQNSAPDFGALAVRYSDDQATRYKGGDVGWVQRDRFPVRIPDPVIEAGFSLESEGDVSEIVDTESGFFLVKLVGKKQAGNVPFEHAKAKIRRTILRDAQAQEKRDFNAQVMESIGVMSDPEKLKGIPFHIPNVKEKAASPPSL